MKKLGLVGGISWVSTMDYYRYINEGVNAHQGGLHFAECLIYSVDFDLFQRYNTAGQWEATFDLLYQACVGLQRGGAEALVLCANTAHAVAPRLQAALSLPLLHIVDATAAVIHQRGFTKVGLLGTQFTMELPFYTEHMKALGLTCLVPSAPATRAFMQQKIKEELGRGLLVESTRKAFLHIIEELKAAGAEAIILGCTELPLLLRPEDVSLPLLDSTRIHAEAAVAYALDLAPLP